MWSTPKAPKELPKSQKLPFKYRMPYRSISNGFIGRSEEFWELYNILNKNLTAVIEGVGVISGAGGIGKTQLAIEYAHRFSDKYIGGIFWIDSDHGKSILLKQLIEGSELEINNELNEKEQIEYLWKKISQFGKVLIILDNFPENEIIQAWLPPSSSIHTIITTRRRDLNISGVSLNFLSIDESINLLNTSKRKFGDEASKLAQILGGLPLALELAKNYLNLRPDIDIDSLITEIKKIGEIKTLAEFAHKYSGELPTGHEKEVVATFKLSWDIISISSKRVLQAMSLVEPVPVPVELLSEILNITFKHNIFNDQIRESISELYKYSLIDIDNDNDPIIHRLIMAFVKTTFNEHSFIYKNLPDSINTIIKKVENDHIRLKKMLPHTEFILQSLATGSSMLNDREVLIKLALPLVGSANKLNTTNYYKNARNSCNVAISVLEKIRQNRINQWSVNLQFILLGAYTNKGNTYHKSKDNNLAIQNYSISLKLCKESYELFGLNERIEVVKSINYANRADMYLKLGKKKQSYKDIDELIQSEEQLQNRIYPNWPISLHSELSKSLSILRETLAKNNENEKQSKVEDLYNTIILNTKEQNWEMLNSLGISYLTKTNWIGAEETFRKSLEISLNECTNEGIIKSYNNLAISLRRQNKLEEAREYCEKALQICVKIDGLKEEYQCLGTLKNILYDQMDIDQVKKIKDRIHNIRNEIGDSADEDLVSV